MMLKKSLAVLLPLFYLGQCRESSRNAKTTPMISNSFVNLGKIDISYHFNTLNPDSPIKPNNHNIPPFFSKVEPISEIPCPCSSLRDIKDPLINDPSKMLKNILMNNDLFSFNKEPVTSTLCCDSHEHVQEDMIYFEIGPKKSETSFFPLSNSPLSQIFFKDFKRPSLPTSGVKPKSIDIFFFPKKKEVSFDFSKNVKKSDINKDKIQIVGDKELKNEFKNYKIKTSVPFTSIKKDLNFQKTQDVKLTTMNEDPQTTDFTTIETNVL